MLTLQIRFWVYNHFSIIFSLESRYDCKEELEGTSLSLLLYGGDEILLMFGAAVTCLPLPSNPLLPSEVL